MTTPQWLDREAACAYLCMKRSAFNRAVRDGRLPQPNNSLGARSGRWAISAIDSFLQRGKSEVATIEDKVNEIAERLRAGGRKGRKAQAR
jgi:predicted DNA-binding transcriptional regulator AlpA